MILSSGKVFSHILTNAHVCGVVEQGGFVITDDSKEHTVLFFQKSNVHDLCLIYVPENLNINSRVSSSSPALYSEAVVSGHPSLLPTIITKGHFSGKQNGQIMTGLKSCTIEDFMGPLSFFCKTLGGIPIFRTFEMQIVSATIKPGSSGSAVYDESGEIAGLVFAGSSDFGYASIVPLSYIQNFLKKEVPSLLLTNPLLEKPVTIDDLQFRAMTVCKNVTESALLPVCKIINNSTLYVK